MEIEWVEIQDFNNYIINSYGEIVNKTTGRLVKPSRNHQGIVKVGLSKEGRQYTRSVSHLVAITFVQGQDDIFDTPIHLDGDQSNNSVENLVWRPRWFAWAYSRQFKPLSENDNIGPIKEINTGDYYKNVYEAGVKNGLLFKDIRKSMVRGEACFPTFQTFSLI